MLAWTGTELKDYWINVNGGHAGTISKMVFVSGEKTFGSRYRLKHLSQGQNQYNRKKRRCKVRVKCEKLNSFSVRFRTKAFFNLKCNINEKYTFPTLRAAQGEVNRLFPDKRVEFVAAN